MITKTSLSPFKKLGSDIITRTATTKLGINVDDPIGTLDIDTGSGGFTVTETTLADDAQVSLDDIIPGQTGLCWLNGTNASATRYVSCCFAMEGDNDNLTEAFDTPGTLELGSLVANRICVIADGDGTYTMTNKLNEEVTLAVMYLGSD
tara:strand:+ start:1121 stop:1567 length:447 start_codon:yes stop_codon:yes gene_type:complete